MKRGIAILVPNSDFTDNNIGEQITFENYDFMNNPSIMNYGKAVMLPRNVDLSDNNVGTVTFLDKVPLSHLEILVNEMYLDKKSNQYVINGRGTVLYPKTYPNTTYAQTVGWSVVSGGEYVKLKRFNTNNYFKYDNNVTEQTKLHGCCYVEIMEGVVGKEVVIQCYSTDEQYNMISTQKKLIVTYNNDITTEELGWVEFINNTGTPFGNINDTQITITAKYYPQNTIHKNCQIIPYNSEYNQEVFEHYDSIKENSEEDYDMYARYLCIYRIWNDLISLGDCNDSYYDAEEKTTTQQWTFNIPRSWQKNLQFESLYTTPSITFYGFQLAYSMNFSFTYNNPLLQQQRKPINVENTLGYVRLTPMENRTEHICIRFNNMIHKASASNQMIGQKIYAQGVYSPKMYVNDIVGDTDNFIVCDIMYNSINDTIYDYKYIGDFVIPKLMCRVVYERESKEFYLLDSNRRFFRWSDEYCQISQDTIVYHLGNLYNVVSLGGNKYDLIKIVDNTEHSRIHRSEYELNFVSEQYEDEPIINGRKPTFVYGVHTSPTSKMLLWSHTTNNIEFGTPHIGGSVSTFYNTHRGNNYIFKNYLGGELNTLNNIYESGKSLHSIVNNQLHRIESTHSEQIDLTNGEIIYFNYSGVYGEYIDIADYKDSFLLQKAVDCNKVFGNSIYGGVSEFIVFTNNVYLDKYTYYKDYPTSLDDMIFKRAICEVDIVIDENGNPINIGWGNDFVYAKFQPNIIQ